MTTYDFKSLSSLDFEELSRDLLQAKVGVFFESFKAGADGGIDLRHSESRSGEKWIVQCKHYAKSGMTRLVSHLANDEKPKVDQINPDRYFLTTSLEANPNDKEKILEALSHHIKSTEDILANSDLNNLLALYPKIEKNHFKLWMCSTPILQQIINSGVFSYSAYTIQKAETRILHYVRGASYAKSLDLLNEHGCCLITGDPGIGKTTLAEMLLIEHLKEGFEPVVISEDISEAFSLLSQDGKQIFYYDDFLGKTSIEEKLGKNEDRRILDLCERCSSADNKRFILTTREYILNSARRRYEELNANNFDFFRCVVSLDSYSLVDRARILFNHLYYSGLSEDYLIETLRDRAYLRIIRHRNFNPRVIEWMTGRLDTGVVEATGYVDEFEKMLSNPFVIWEHAFENQISPHARRLMLVMATMPGGADVRYLEQVFRLYGELKGIQSSSTTYQQVRSALKELGNL